MFKGLLTALKVDDEEKPKAIKINDYVAYGRLGQMKVMVDYTKAENFWIELGNNRLYMDTPLRKDEIFWINGKPYSLGVPALEYSEFLDDEKNIDLNFPVILDAFVIDISRMSKSVLSERKLLRDTSEKYILLGTSFANPKVDDGVTIATSVIIDAWHEDICGISVLLVETLEGEEYIVTKSSKEDVRFFKRKCEFVKA